MKSTGTFHITDPFAASESPSIFKTFNTMKKPLDAHQKDQLIHFLADSKEIEAIASTRLATRRAERSKLCADLKQELPKLDRARTKAEDELAKCDKARHAAHDAHRQAGAARHIAYVNASSAGTTYEKFLSRTHRQLAELADPRIHKLSKWVHSLENRVRCEAPEFEIKWHQAWNGTFEVDRKAPQNQRSQSWFERANSACKRLIEITGELELLSVSDYGDDLADRLAAIKLQASETAATVIPPNVMQEIMEESPDMGRLPLMY